MQLRTICAVLQRVQKLFIVSLLVLAVGAHWAILQSAAWVGMLFTYSHKASFEQAWTKTFSGKYPCKLCKLVAEGRKGEQQKPPMLKLELKMDFAFVAGAALFHPPRPHQQFVAVTETAPSLNEAPPTPPPRLA